jgi:hypothetical protein
MRIVYEGRPESLHALLGYSRTRESSFTSPSRLISKMQGSA